MYKVICRFADLQDDGHIYEVGDTYPREGDYHPTKKRKSELSSTKNLIGVPLIEYIEEETEETV